MTHVNIDLDKLDWTPFLMAQEGKGSGLDGGSRYFQGIRYQRGFGLMASVGRFLMPIVRNIASSAGEQAIQAGRNVLEDVAKGRSIQEAVAEHGSQGLQTVAKKLQQCGKGRRRKKLPLIKTTINPFPSSKKQKHYRDQLSGNF